MKKTTRLVAIIERVDGDPTIVSISVMHWWERLLYRVKPVTACMPGYTRAMDIALSVGPRIVQFIVPELISDEDVQKIRLVLTPQPEQIRESTRLKGVSDEQSDQADRRP